MDDDIRLLQAVQRVQGHEAGVSRARTAEPNPAGPKDRQSFEFRIGF